MFNRVTYPQVPIPALLFSHVTLEKSLHFSQPQFPWRVTRDREERKESVSITFLLFTINHPKSWLKTTIYYYPSQFSGGPGSSHLGGCSYSHLGARHPRGPLLWLVFYAISHLAPRLGLCAWVASPCGTSLSQYGGWVPRGNAPKGLRQELQGVRFSGGGSGEDLFPR